MKREPHDPVKRHTSFAGHSVTPPPLPRRRPSDPSVQYRPTLVPQLPSHNPVHEETEPPLLPDKSHKKSPSDVLTSPTSTSGDKVPALPPRRPTLGVTPLSHRTTVLSTSLQSKPTTLPNKPNVLRKTVCPSMPSSGLAPPQPHKTHSPAFSESEYSEPTDNKPVTPPPVPSRTGSNTNSTSSKPVVMPRPKLNSTSSATSESSDL